VRIPERDFQRSVMELAELSGWETLHCRTSMQQGRYLTATTGTMAKGWPDLVLVHWRYAALLFVELKADRGQVTADQGRVHDVLIAAGLEVRVWRPKDWPKIESTLTFRERSAV
jgi:hypothetical protein